MVSLRSNSGHLGRSSSAHLVRSCIPCICDTLDPMPICGCVVNDFDLASAAGGQGTVSVTVSGSLSGTPMSVLRPSILGGNFLAECSAPSCDSIAGTYTCGCNTSPPPEWHVWTYVCTIREPGDIGFFHDYWYVTEWAVANWSYGTFPQVTFGFSNYLVTARSSLVTTPPPTGIQTGGLGSLSSPFSVIALGTTATGTRYLLWNFPTKSRYRHEMLAPCTTDCNAVDQWAACFTGSATWDVDSNDYPTPLYNICDPRPLTIALSIV